MFHEEIHGLPLHSSNLAEAYYRVLGVLMHAQELKVTVESECSARAVELVAMVGKEVGLSEPDLSGLKLGTYLRDIGMIVIPERVLNKRGPLTAREHDFLKEHPVLGAWMLQPIRGELEPQILDIVLYHHERVDGTGYPDGLARESIPLVARICSICDAWCAMTRPDSPRRYRTGEDAVAELRRCSGTQFDPELVALFVGSVLPNTARELTVHTAPYIS